MLKNRQEFKKVLQRRILAVRVIGCTNVQIVLYLQYVLMLYPKFKMALSHLGNCRWASRNISCVYAYFSLATNLAYPKLVSSITYTCSVFAFLIRLQVEMIFSPAFSSVSLLYHMLLRKNGVKITFVGNMSYRQMSWVFGKM